MTGILRAGNEVAFMTHGRHEVCVTSFVCASALLLHQLRLAQVTFNSLIAACAQGAQWEKAAELFEQMHGRGCRPDPVTYGGLIAAYEKARPSAEFSCPMLALSPFRSWLFMLRSLRC